MSYVLDSSCAAKLIINENGTDEMYAIMRLALEKNVPLIASELVFYELGNVLWKYAKRQKMNVGGIFDDVFDLNVTFVPMDPALASAALNIACGEDVTFYDATHVALAKRHGAKLITEDELLSRKFECAIGIKTAVREIEDLEEGR